MIFNRLPLATVLTALLCASLRGVASSPLQASVEALDPLVRLPVPPTEKLGRPLYIILRLALLLLLFVLLVRYLFFPRSA